MLIGRSVGVVSPLKSRYKEQEETAPAKTTCFSSTLLVSGKGEKIKRKKGRKGKRKKISELLVA